jgi:CRP/FNR family transcriptional regulator
MVDITQNAELNLEASVCAAIEQLLEKAEPVFIPSGTLFRSPTLRASFIWIVSGSVRFYKHAADGREITLCRQGANQFCLLCLSRLILGDVPAYTRGVAETEVRGFVVAREECERAISHSPDFARYLLRTMTKHLHDVAALMSVVAFDKLDLRLACHLGRMFERSNNQPIEMTHDDIVREMGTSREVISRLLKRFENQGCIRLARGMIGPVALQELQDQLRGGSDNR